MDGLDALQLTRLAWFTPFLQNYFGRETLFFYLQGLALAGYGLSIFSLRFVSVVAATLTIPLVYLVGYRLTLANPPLFGPKKEFRLRPSAVGLLAAAGLAGSYWHLYFSRVAFRAILLPPLLLALVWCFWRGWFASDNQGRGGSKGWLIAAGILLGLTFYTYLAARLLPLLFLLFFITELFQPGFSRAKKTLDFLLFGGVATLVSLPLLLYFWQTPQAFVSRTQALSIFAGDAPLKTLAGNLLALLKMHLGVGSGQWPALNPLSVVGFWLGLVFCLYHFRQPMARLALLWGAVGLAPVLFSRQDWTATTTLLRGIVAWPALFLISATGLASLESSRFKLLHPLASPLLLLLIGSLLSIYQYFFVWATTYNNFSDHPAQIARYLNQQTGPPILVPLKFYGENVTNFLMQARYPTLTNGSPDLLRSVFNSSSKNGQTAIYLWPDKSTGESAFALLIPSTNGPGQAYLLPPLSPAQVEALAGYTRHTASLFTLPDDEGEPIARVYPLGDGSPFSSSPVNRAEAQPMQANFNHQILLTDYSLEPARLKPGQTVTLGLNWQAMQPIDGDYYLFIHLFDLSSGQRWGQLNLPLTGTLFNAHRWPVGLTVPDPHSFPLPAAAPDGPYRFEVGLYHPASLQRLPVMAADGSVLDDKVILGKFWVQRQPPPAPQQPVTPTQFGETIALVGLDPPVNPLRPGQTFTYNLYWQALAPITSNYTVFTHLLDAAGNLQAQQDQPPQQGRYPTSWWTPGEIVSDTYTLTLPPQLSPGAYTLRVGLYAPETGQRLPLKNQDGDFVDFSDFIKLQN